MVIPKSILLLALLWVCLPASAQQIRSYDGSMNNPTHPTWGQAGEPILRVTTNGYADLMAAAGGTTRPNPRLISNVIFNQTERLPNALGLSDFWWTFGQFIDHDITLVDNHPVERLDIPVPAFDAFFDPLGTGTQVIPMRRAMYDPATGLEPDNPRAQINEITAWIDGSNIYGSSESRARWLRTGIQGKLKISSGGLLPFNTTTGQFSDPIDLEAPFMDSGGRPQKHFVAGDIRANEQPTLTALHTLFVREHNRLCDTLATSNPDWTDEQLFQHARRMVIGFIQVIAFEEWLPALGVQLDHYSGYDVSVKPNIMSVFAAAAFRFGHSLIDSEITRLSANGGPFVLGNVPLRDAFFNPSILLNEGGLRPLLRGMAVKRQQALDTKVVHDLRNFLFGPPGASGLDLVALNINRGRDCGLADYNTIRADMGLAKVSTFNEITADPVLHNNLLDLYETVDDIDPWVGMLAEEHLSGAAVGETIATILKRQFESLRDGDRFYYENDPALSADEVTTIGQTRLSHIIRRNTDIDTFQEEAFFVVDPVNTVAESSPPVPDDFMRMNVYPNPIRSAYTLRLNARQSEAITLRLFDVLGRVVESHSLKVNAGMNEFKLDFNRQLAPGMYVFALQSAETVRTVRVVKH